jgi:hypothetical protein
VLLQNAKETAKNVGMSKNELDETLLCIMRV